MGWTTRNGKQVFYESRRLNGRPTKLYRGSGPAAEAAAAEVERRRNERVERAKSLMADEAAHAAAIGPLDELCDLTDLLAGTALVLAGFRLHARSEWRRRRDDRDN